MPDKSGWRLYHATRRVLDKMIFNTNSDEMCGYDLDDDLELEAWAAIKSLLDGDEPLGDTVDTVRRVLIDVANGRIVPMNIRDVATGSESNGEGR
jgi:hypothetical protein